MKIQLPQQLTCQRPTCGHVWTPRIEHVTICPHCKSAKWDVPRKDRTMPGADKRGRRCEPVR